MFLVYSTCNFNISRSNSGREFFNSFCSWLVRDWSFL